MEKPQPPGIAGAMPPPGAGGHMVYEGLPVWAKLLVILLGLLGGAAYCSVSSVEAFRLQNQLGYAPSDAELLKAISGQAIENGTTPVAFVVHALNVQTHLKAITNRQAIGVLSVGTGIALFAIGFALFIIGADGAFKVHLQTQTDVKLVLYGTAPGLLCFFLGALIIAVAGYSSRYDLELGTYASQTTKALAADRHEPVKPFSPKILEAASQKTPGE